MGHVEFSVLIARPQDQVFQYASDLRRLPEWGDGVIDCEMITEGPIDVGSIFIVKNKRGNKVRAFESQVVIFEPNARFGFQTGNGAMGYTSVRTFERKHRTTLITERITIEVSGLLKLAAPLLMNFVKQSHHNSLLKLREILER